MNERSISSVALDKLEASLKECIPVTEIYHHDAVTYVKSSSNKIITGKLSVAMSNASINETERNVLLEQNTRYYGIKFVNCGDYFINKQLAQKFGGCVSGVRYWVLYNETEAQKGKRGAVYGYKGDHLPTAEEVIQYIEELCK